MKKNVYVIAFIVAVLAILVVFFTGGFLAIQYTLKSDARQQGAVATLIALACAIPLVGIVTWLVIRPSK